MRTAIKARREEILHLLNKGMSEAEISEQLGVSRQTVVRDVSYMKKLSRLWFDSLPKDGFIFEYQLGLNKIRENGLYLYKLRDQAIDVMQKLAITRTIDANEKLYLELLSETPTISALKKSLGEKNVQ